MLDRVKRASWRSPNNASMFQAMICVFDNVELHEEILNEAHDRPYTTHLGKTRIYQDLKPHC